MEDKITIGIPTYNRKNELLRLLKSIESENLDDVYEVLICDNKSNFSIETEILAYLSSSFQAKCRIFKNSVNIGGHGNIKNLYIHCHSKWLWMIGDDDQVTKGCLDIISHDIKKYPDCTQFRYSIETSINGVIAEELEDDYEMKSLGDFINYYTCKTRSKGNLIFMSNNVINMEKMSPYIQYAFTYNPPISQIIPALVGLDNKAIEVRYRNKIVCRYVHPESGTQWNLFRVMLTMSNMCQIPWKSLDSSLYAKFMEIFIFTSFQEFAYWCFHNKDKISNKDLLTNIYRNLFSYGSGGYHVSQKEYKSFLCQYCKNSDNYDRYLDRQKRKAMLKHCMREILETLHIIPSKK